MRATEWAIRVLSSHAVRDTAQRALNTFAQALLAGITVGTVVGTTAVAWGPVLAVAGLATLTSILQSIIRHTGGGINYNG